jgi:hypothetical protein
MKTAVAFFALVLALSSCAPSVTVRSDYDRQAKFSRYNTYTIKTDPARNNDPIMGSPLNQKRITEVLDAEMKARGYTRVEDTAADLLITFGTDSRDRQQIQSNNTMSSMWWWMGPQNNISSRTYEENRIIVNIFDAQTKNMVWQGWASGQLGDRKRDRDLVVRETVYKIMREYPQKAFETYNGK